MNDVAARRAALSRVVTGQIADAIKAREFVEVIDLLKALAGFDPRQAVLVHDTITTGLAIAAVRDRKGTTMSDPAAARLLAAAREPLQHPNVDLDAALPAVVAAVLRVAADLVDLGPAIPLPPSIISTLLRENAEDVEAVDAGVTFG